MAPQGTAMTKATCLKTVSVLAFVVALVAADSAMAQRSGGGGRGGGGGGGGGGGNSQRSSGQQFNAQRFNSPQLNTQRFNTQQFNSQRSNTQQLEARRFNNQQLDSQRVTNQQLNGQRFNGQQLNNQQRLNTGNLGNVVGNNNGNVGNNNRGDNNRGNGNNNGNVGNGNNGNGNGNNGNVGNNNNNRGNGNVGNNNNGNNGNVGNNNRGNDNRGNGNVGNNNNGNNGNVGNNNRGNGNNNGNGNIFGNNRKNDRFDRFFDRKNDGKFGQFNPSDRNTCTGGAGGAIGACGRITLLKDEPRRNRAFAHFNRAFLLERIGAFKEALEDYDSAIELDPTDIDPYVNRARVWAKKQDAPRAIADLDEALKLDPKNVNALIQRGSQFDAERNTDKAIADFDAALQLDPNSVAALNEKAQALLRANRVQEALEIINAALAIDANAASALDTRARIFEVLGQLDNAFADVNKAVGIDAEDREINRTFVEIKAKIDLAKAAANPALVAPVLAPVGEKRIALIIGNAKYTGATPLKNTQTDALAVATKLAALGFSSVELGDDLKRDDMKAVLDGFAEKAKNADWAVIYYAGHGMEIGGNNWLIPVDAKVAEGADMASQAISLDTVIASIENAKKLRLVILDACRDNPFGSANQQGFARGLGRIEPAGATLVAYAAKHGQAASDGEGAHSPFVASLLKHMDTPGLEINRLFRRVADEVFNTTKTQEPFTYGRLPDEDLYLKPVNPTASAAAKADGSFKVSSN
jgi:tetratricopeptide (TPR) repeat protein